MSDFPYPGLRPFHRDEVDIFFGRDEQIDQLLARLDKKRFLAVVGPSGCGKSSLVQTGLLNALETGFLASAGVRWRMATLRPGNHPLRNLARALLEKEALGPERGGDENSEAFLLATLRRGPLGLVEIRREVALPQNTNLLVLVDQFEEIFRYRQQYDINEADAFVALLLASAAQPEVRLYVLITMRSDFLGDCTLFAGLPEVLNDSQFLTPRLTREQLQEAIIGPARVFDGEAEPALVNRLLNDMGTDPDQLPLMQHALMRLWNRASQQSSVLLTLRDYEAIGGLKEALSRHADEAYEPLDAAQKVIAETLFRSLCERSAARRDTRRPVRLEDVAEVAGVKWEQVAAVVEVFRHPDRSFLMPPIGTPLKPDTIIDISHESLIRQWQRLSDWVEAEAASADTYRRLVETARLWKDDKAAPWGTPDLENALVWREKQQPNPAWAQRYGGDFELAKEFLDASEAKREADRQREEAKRQEELRRTRRQLTWAMLGLIVALALAGWAWWERSNAERERAHAQQAESKRTHDLFESHLTHASMLARVEDYAAARDTLNKSRELDKDIPAERRHARNLLSWFVDLMGGTAEQVYEGAGAPLKRVAVSSDGRLLAAVGEKGTVVLFDAESGKLLRRLDGHTETVKSAVFHPQGDWLATAGDDRRILFWFLPAGEKLREWQAPDQVKRLALSPDGKRLAGAGTDHNVTLWDVSTGEVLQTLKGHTRAIHGLAFSPDGNLLASAAYDNTARLWDLRTGEVRYVLQGHTDRVEFVAFSPDGQWLATSSADKHVRLWDVESGQAIALLQGHQNAVLGLTFVDSGRLVSASMDRTLRLWDTASGVTLRVFQGHQISVSDVAVKDEHLYSASNDGTVRRWSLQPQPAFTVIDLPGKPYSAAIAPNGSRVAVGFADGGLRLYALPDSRLLWEKAGAHKKGISRLAFSPDGQQLASASMDNTMKLWQTSDGQLVQTFSGHSRSVYAVAFSPDGQTLATASYDGQLGLFRIGEEQGRFHKAHDGDVNSVAFNTSGKRLVSTGDDGVVRLWDLASWPPVLQQEFPKAGDIVLWAAFSPGGSCIASVGRDGMAHILNARNGQEEQTLIGHENTIYRVAFSPDGGQVATVSGDATVRFWDLTAGTALFTLRLPTNRLGGSSLWDFDFRCTGPDCWIAVPLTRGKLVLYHLTGIYGE
jgi:WD40 repeat protein/energy-coupling factor transporter ATP-binding protein EcfA2